MGLPVLYQNPPATAVPPDSTFSDVFYYTALGDALMPGGTLPLLNWFSNFTHTLTGASDQISSFGQQLVDSVEGTVFSLPLLFLYSACISSAILRLKGHSMVSCLTYYPLMAWLFSRLFFKIPRFVLRLGLNIVFFSIFMVTVLTSVLCILIASIIFSEHRASFFYTVFTGKPLLRLDYASNEISYVSNKADDRIAEFVLQTLEKFLPQGMLLLSPTSNQNAMPYHEKFGNFLFQKWVHRYGPFEAHELLQDSRTNIILSFCGALAHKYGSIATNIVTLFHHYVAHAREHFITQGTLAAAHRSVCVVREIICMAQQHFIIYQGKVCEMFNRISSDYDRIVRISFQALEVCRPYLTIVCRGFLWLIENHRPVLFASFFIICVTSSIVGLLRLFYLVLTYEREEVPEAALYRRLGSLVCGVVITLVFAVLFTIVIGCLVILGGFTMAAAYSSRWIGSAWTIAHAWIHELYFDRPDKSTNGELEKTLAQAENVDPVNSEALADSSESSVKQNYQNPLEEVKDNSQSLSSAVSEATECKEVEPQSPSPVPVDPVTAESDDDSDDSPLASDVMTHLDAFEHEIDPASIELPYSCDDDLFLDEETTVVALPPADSGCKVSKLIKEADNSDYTSVPSPSTSDEDLLARTLVDPASIPLDDDLLALIACDILSPITLSLPSSCESLSGFESEPALVPLPYSSDEDLTLIDDVAVATVSVITPLTCLPADVDPASVPLPLTSDDDLETVCAATSSAPVSANGEKTSTPPPELGSEASMLAPITEEDPTEEELRDEPRPVIVNDLMEQFDIGDKECSRLHDPKSCSIPQDHWYHTHHLVLLEDGSSANIGSPLPVEEPECSRRTTAIPPEYGSAASIWAPRMAAEKENLPTTVQPEVGSAASMWAPKTAVEKGNLRQEREMSNAELELKYPRVERTRERGRDLTKTWRHKRFD